MDILLYEFRTKRNMSIRRLAARAGLSAGTIWNIENCRTSPTLDELEVLAAALGCGMVDLFDSLYKRSKK